MKLDLGTMLICCDHIRDHFPNLSLLVLNLSCWTMHHVLSLRASLDLRQLPWMHLPLSCFQMVRAAPAVYQFASSIQAVEPPPTNTVLLPMAFSFFAGGSCRSSKALIIGAVAAGGSSMVVLSRGDVWTGLHLRRLLVTIQTPGPPPEE